MEAVTTNREIVANHLAYTCLYMFLVAASRKKALWVVFFEYCMIAWIASFGVVFAIAVLGELYFIYMLHRSYPISILVVCLTSAAVTVFVLGCCLLAWWQNTRKSQTEIIRDE